MLLNTKLIAIEGIDGSGKTLQSKMLMDTLLKKNYNCGEFSFPAYESFFGTEIGTMLSGKSKVRADVVDSKSMALWYAMDRWNQLNLFDFKRYDLFLLNRYVLSNAVYQSIRAEEAGFAKWVFELEHDVLHLPVPDIYIILDINESLSNENVLAKGFRDYTGTELDVYEKSDDILTKARKMYLFLAKSYDNAVIINCMKNGKMNSPQEIHKMIMTALVDKNIITVK